MTYWIRKECLKPLDCRNLKKAVNRGSALRHSETVNIRLVARKMLECQLRVRLRREIRCLYFVNTRKVLVIIKIYIYIYIYILFCYLQFS